MKHHWVLALLVLLALASDSGAQNNSPSRTDDYVLVFNDEFNQPNGSRPDPTKWRVPARDKNVRWKRWVSDSPHVCYVKNGTLVCRAIPHKPDASDTAKIWTGAVDTRHTYTFQYGKVEVRMKTNLKRGNSPAAWMFVDKSKGDCPYGEIDIFESFNDVAVAKHTVHTHQSWTLKKPVKQNLFSEKLSVNKWHVYGVEWTKDYLLFTVDGRNVGVYRRSALPQDIAEGQWTFDMPFFILLNQSLYGVTEINTIYETRFDWIRVYQKAVRN